MAKEAAVLRTELGEVRFGKNDKIAAVPLGPVDLPTGVAFVARDGRIERFEMADLPSEMHTRLAWHGLKQKLKDSHAAIEDADECLEASLKVFGQLAGGLWAGTGVGGDSSLLEAVVTVTGQEREKVREILKALKPAEREALRQHAPIKAELDRRSAERTKGIDVGALLGTLGD